MEQAEMLDMIRNLPEDKLDLFLNFLREIEDTKQHGLNHLETSA